MSLGAERGIDFRFDTTTGEARGNVLTGTIRNRDGATHTASDNLANIAQGTFEQMYTAPLLGDLRKKGELAALIGKGPTNADAPNDYCLRTRTGAWDLGALQHSLGDCSTVPPPLGGSSSGGDGGASSSGGNGPGGGADGGSSGTDPGSSSGASPDGASDDGGCGCRVTRASDASAFALAGAAFAVGLARRRRRR